MAFREIVLLAGAAVAAAVPLVEGTKQKAEAAIMLPPVDRIVVEKSAHRLTVYSQGNPVHVFDDIQLGLAPEGPKQFQGDRKTPEGSFVIDRRNPQSSYHRSLHISYPDEAAREFAASQGRSPGGDIFIHGQPNQLAEGRIETDWTDGCIALSNREIDALWAAVPDGTPIDIKP